MDTEALAAHLDICRRSGASGCLIAYKGYIVQEWYDSTYAPYIDIRSAAKSLVGILTGMLLADGKIKSIDEPVSTYIPEWKAGIEDGVTIRHLLTMTAGLRNRTQDGDSDPGVVGARNTTAYVLSLPLDWSPGERWAYSNESVQLLSPLLERAAGIPLSRYARERLLDPLYMNDTSFHVDEYYNTVTFSAVKTTLRDFAKIGQLMLNGGLWNGKQVVPSEWVRQSIQPIAQQPNYGFLWWIDPPRHNFAATGSFDNNCIVFPDLDLVVARLQRDPRPDAKMRYQSVQTLELIRRVVEQGAGLQRGSAGEAKVDAVKSSEAWMGYVDLYASVEEMPIPAGGIGALLQRIAMTVREQKTCPVHQQVLIAFVVDKTGKVGATRLEEGTADVCTSAVEEVLRKELFTPGLHDGAPVHVLLKLPVTIDP